VATTKDNLALVVLCSTLGYSSAKNDKDSDIAVKPLTVATYNKLEAKLNEANLTPAVFLTEKLTDIASQLGLAEKETDQIENLLHRADKLGEELDRLAEKKIYVTSRTQENYPAKLKAAMGKQSPIIFFYCGDMRLLDCETVAIIGSREVTDQETEYASKHARISAQNNRVIVSGGAKGIDTIAKDAALHAGGNVVTYVSDNMTGYIEKNADFILYDRMLVLSSFHPSATFKGYNALERNKYIYASSDYAVVVSSGDGTGGSFKGAADCLKKNYCPLYVKDDAFSPLGNKKLIELGGLPVNEEHERLGR
jgi:predicted Rossmann fold nucleotide-binding protein DprA/Smf involved in DNA uptake